MRLIKMNRLKRISKNINVNHKILNVQMNPNIVTFYDHNNLLLFFINFFCTTLLNLMKNLSSQQSEFFFSKNGAKHLNILIKKMRIIRHKKMQNKH